MDQIEIDHLTKEVSDFCQQKLAEVIYSPTKQAIILCVVAALLTPPETPPMPTKWLYPG